MKQLIVMLTLIILSSCGLLRKYPDNEVVQFDKCLLESEKQEVINKGVFYKDWDGICKDGGYSKGLLQIRIDSFRPNKYLFIKNGLWSEYHKTFSKQYVKIIENYDRFGNKIYGQTYVSSSDTSKGFALIFKEELDTLNMTTTFIRYYDNGKIKYIQFGKPLNYNDYISYYYKGISVDSIKAFNTDGYEIDPKKINTYDMFYFKPAKCK